MIAGALLFFTAYFRLLWDRQRPIRAPFLGGR